MPTEISLLHLSDLHMQPADFFIDENRKSQASAYYELFLKERRIDAISWTKENIERIISAFASYNFPKIDHVVVTGDLVTCGFEEEFEKVKEALLQLQKKIFNISADTLQSQYFSIIPGNHDVTADKKEIGKLKASWYSFQVFLVYNLSRIKLWRKLPEKTANSGYSFDKLYSLFKKSFESVYGNSDNFNKLENSVYVKRLKIQDYDTNINIIHLNTATNIPVHKIGWNALGHVTDKQLNSLAAIDEDRIGFNILLMHHPPLPNQSITVEDKYLELVYSQYIYSSLSRNGKIHIILCGHKHVLYLWDNKKLGNAPVPYIRNDIPVLISGASTESDANNNIYLPLYTIETSDRENINYNNSNIKVSLLRVSDDAKISQSKESVNLSRSGLGEVQQLFKEIIVNDESRSILTAEDNFLIIKNPQNDEYIDVPVKAHLGEWNIKFNIMEKDFFHIDIVILNSTSEIKEVLKSKVFINASYPEIPFPVNEKNGVVRIKFHNISCYRIFLLISRSEE